MLAKTQDKANQAKAAVEGGQPWEAVAAAFSTDPGTKASGGFLLAVPEGQQVQALGDAMFSAKVGVVGGPVKTQVGYVVFRVDKVMPGQQQSLKQSAAAIRQQLLTQQQAKFAAFTTDLQEVAQPHGCQKGYQTQDCKYAPKAQPAVAPPAGAGAPAGGATTNK